MSWGSIGVPRPLYERIKNLARRRKTRIWVVVENAIEFYERATWRLGDNVSDKGFYVAAKILISLGRFLENPTKQNAEYLKRNIKAAGVEDIENVLHLIDSYTRTRDKAETIALREAVMRVAKQVLAKKE